ncbi:HTH-type transcriptional regulator LysM [Candidatus Burarchaeum australiense]|nr:HTH-type transcriptional regulator LysM [Candidatus Burarchaeum australiense]
MERGLNVFIGVVSEEKTPTSEIVRRIARVEGVNTVYELTGNFDIMVQASSHAASELNKIIERVRACEGVVSSTTYLVLQRHDNR